MAKFEVTVVLEMEAAILARPVLFSMSVSEAMRPLSGEFVAFFLEGSIALLQVFNPLSEVHVAIIEVLLAEAVLHVSEPLSGIMETIVIVVLTLAVSHAI